MSLKDAERNLKGMGKTIAQNTPALKNWPAGFERQLKVYGSFGFSSRFWFCLASQLRSG